MRIVIEVIDNENNKRMAKVMCGIDYSDCLYVLYLIQRDNENVNIFGSKVIENSEGIKVIDSEFLEEEKIKLEDISKRLFNKESVCKLDNDGIKIVRDIDLNDGVNKFDIQKSYIATMSNDEIDVCMMYYGLIGNKKKVITIKKETKKVSEGFISNILVLIFAITFFSICISLLIDIIF